MFERACVRALSCVRASLASICSSSTGRAVNVVRACGRALVDARLGEQSMLVRACGRALVVARPVVYGPCCSSVRACSSRRSTGGACTWGCVHLGVRALVVARPGGQSMLLSERACSSRRSPGRAVHACSSVRACGREVVDARLGVRALGGACTWGCVH